MAIEADKHADCNDWAEQGECDNNPDYMLTHCATSCKNAVQQHAAAAAALRQELANISSFYDLRAPDIDGKMITFDIFRGKVTIITNVASFCGYTASHYKVCLHCAYFV
jgi:Glutathione peroxidase/ShK domain-like